MNILYQLRGLSLFQGKDGAILAVLLRRDSIFGYRTVKIPVLPGMSKEAVILSLSTEMGILPSQIAVPFNIDFDILRDI